MLSVVGHSSSTSSWNRSKLVLKDLELVHLVVAVLEQHAQRVKSPQTAICAAHEGKGVCAASRQTHGQAGRRHEHVALDKVAHVSEANDGVVRQGAGLQADVALEVVVPVEEVGLEGDAVGFEGECCLGAGEVEVCEGRTAADGGGGDVIGMRGEAACNVDDVAGVDGSAGDELLGMDRPEGDGTVAVTQADAVDVDPREGGCVDGVLGGDAKCGDRRDYPIYIKHKYATSGPF